MVRTLGLTHIALAVKDVERSVEFYQKLIGAEIVYRNEGFAQVQTPGSYDVIVFEQKSKSAGIAGGIMHFGFKLFHPDDIDQAVLAAKEAGVNIIDKGEFCPGEPYIFITDPDGYTVEIWYEP